MIEFSLDAVTTKIKSLILACLLIFIFSNHALGGNDDYKVYVLCYHHFVEGTAANDSEMNKDMFRKQMEYIKESSLEVISLTEFYEYYHQGGFPQQAVLLTFDDGYASFFHYAYPVLLEMEFPALVLPIIANMEGFQRRIVYSERLSFHQMRLMHQQSGGLITYASHSYDLHYYRSNDNLPAIMPQEQESQIEYVFRIKQDLFLSKALLELQLDQEVIALAWPYGISTPLALEQAVAVGMEIIFDLGNRPFTAEDSRLTIPRILPPHDCFASFKAIFLTQ